MRLWTYFAPKISSYSLVSSRSLAFFSQIRLWCLPLYGRYCTYQTQCKTIAFIVHFEHLVSTLLLCTCSAFSPVIHWNKDIVKLIVAALFASFCVLYFTVTCKPTCPPTYLPVYISIYPPTYPPTQPPIYLPTLWPTYLFFFLSSLLSTLLFSFIHLFKPLISSVFPSFFPTVAEPES